MLNQNMLIKNNKIEKIIARWHCSNTTLLVQHSYTNFCHQHLPVLESFAPCEVSASHNPHADDLCDYS